MHECDLVALGATEIASLLEGKENEILEVVKKAYQLHACGDSSLPHSCFLRFPENPGSRIIALPAYLGGDINSAGIKWIASFPGNLDKGIDRASALLILNSPQTGRPTAVLEGSIISAKRTAASAALAARLLDRIRSPVAGIVGCGPINFETIRFLLCACPYLRSFILFDHKWERAHDFKLRCDSFFKDLNLDVQIVSDSDQVFRQAKIISLATTAVSPHVKDIGVCVTGATILHISLRDLSPEIVLASDNIVDDIDHVCRERTSVDLAEQLVGHRNFIRGTLADLLEGRIGERDRGEATIFSPFGLGILDIALGDYVLRCAKERGNVPLIRSFMPQSWKAGRSLEPAGDLNCTPTDL
jgi:ornithine cyclodeaminase